MSRQKRVPRIDLAQTPTAPKNLAAAAGVVSWVRRKIGYGIQLAQGWRLLQAPVLDQGFNLPDGQLHFSMELANASDLEQTIVVTG